MAVQTFTDNAKATLASSITNIATSLTLATGKGALFPALSGGDWFMLTLTQATAETSWEIVKVTARSGDVLTIVRAQEGTTAAPWSAADKAELRLTAAFLARQATLSDTQTLTNKTLTNPAINGFAGDTTAINIGSGQFVKDASGNVTFGTGSALVTNASGVGYGTGAGGTATQSTSKGTGVTLNKPTGQITMNNAALAAGAAVNFYLTNSVIGSGDNIIVSLFAGGAFQQSYTVRAGTYTGGAQITLTNVTAGSLSDAVVMTFTVIKGAFA